MGKVRNYVGAINSVSPPNSRTSREGEPGVTQIPEDIYEIPQGLG